MSVYTFTATVTSEDNITAVATQPFTVGTGGGTQPTTGIFGATVTDKNVTSTIVADIQAWEALINPIGAMKIYFQNANNPPPASVTAAAGNAHIQAAAQLGIPVILCFQPAVSGSSPDPLSVWPGSIYPAQGNASTTGTILGDRAQMIASCKGLMATGLNVIGACFWQEADNNHNFGTGNPITQQSQYTFLYYQNYAAWKAAIPGVPLGCALTGNNNPYATSSLSTNWIPGPTALRTTDTQYTDWITVDLYCGEMVAGNDYVYQNGPGNAPNTGSAGHPADIADYINANGTKPCAFGWIEAGNSGSGGHPTEPNMVAYLSSASFTDPNTGTVYAGDPVNSIQATFKYRLAHNLPCMPFLWYQDNSNTSGPNVITQKTDYRIPLLKSIAKTLSGS